MRCFFCENIEVGFAVLDKQEYNHLFKVLRAVSGTEIMLIDGKGKSASGVVLTDKNIKIFDRKVYDAPAHRVHLFIAQPKKNKMDILLSQCVEAGVWAIHPVIAERSVSIPKNDKVKDRLKDKLLEGCKQAHNPFLPKVHGALKLEAAVKSAVDNGYKAYYGEVEQHGALSIDSLRNELRQNNVVDIAWFVGPEGGFTDDETAMMKAAGFVGISLGRWVMRVETAAVTGVNLLQ